MRTLCVSSALERSAAKTHLPRPRRRFKGSRERVFLDGIVVIEETADPASSMTAILARKLMCVPGEILS
jgi:hypothetical protein